MYARDAGEGLTQAAMYHDKVAAAASQRAMLGQPIRDRGMLEVSADGIGSAIDQLQQAIESLACRLGPVMRPESPATQTTAGNAAEPVCSHVVGYLQNLRRRVDNLSDRVSAIDGRLEV